MNRKRRDTSRQRPLHAYHVKDEPVTDSQDGDGFDGDDIPSAVGHQVELSEPDLGTWVTEIGGHGAGAVTESMERDQPWAR